MRVPASQMSVTEIRNRLCTLLQDRQGPEVVEITRRGRPIGLLLCGSAVRAKGKALLRKGPAVSRKTLRGSVEIQGDLGVALRRVRARLWQGR
jgi:antitoxin (DNA-binding transcriptional repressor) of toxin-antitoxin stability system